MCLWSVRPREWLSSERAGATSPVTCMEHRQPSQLWHNYANEHYQTCYKFTTVLLYYTVMHHDRPSNLP